MSEQQDQRGTAHDALLVAVGTARLAGWIGLVAGVGLLIYTFVGTTGVEEYWTYVILAVLAIGFGITWSLIARVGGALGAMVRR